jgi:hypothetical protein
MVMFAFVAENGCPATLGEMPSRLNDRRHEHSEP